MRRLALVLLVGAALVLVAPADAQETTRGRELYETGCSSCHGIDGGGTSRAPSLAGAGAAGAHFYLSTGRMPMDDVGRQAERKEPAYTDEQIADLVAYVASLGGGPAIPTVDAGAGSLVDGKRLYTAHCAACHNSAGSGGALGQTYWAPSLTEATPVQVAEAVRIGPGAMPVFGPGTLDDGELSDVVRYVRYLRSPDDRGGLPLGRVGPVPEGFVAWVVGLGAMLLGAFWIGTRE